MATTAATFRTHYRAFSDLDKFPDDSINFWLLWASLMLNKARLGTPAPLLLLGAAIQGGGGAGYAAGDTITLGGGTYNTAAVLMVDAVDDNGAVTAAHVVNVGVYVIVPSNPVSQGTTSGAGVGAEFNLTWGSGTPTTYDLLTELYVAHNLALELRTNKEAAAGGVPGTTTGPLTSKSVDKLSVAYDVNAGIEEKAGHWSLTVYGSRFIRLARMFGMGPVVIHGGRAPPLSGAYGAWVGPPVDLGFGQDE